MGMRASGRPSRYHSLLFASLALLFVLRWGNGSASAEEVVIVISPHNESIRQEFGIGFSKWHERVHGERARIEWRDVGGSSEGLRFVQSEFAKKPKGIGVDCMFGGGWEPYLLLAQKELLEPYRLPSSILDPLPKSLAGLDLYDAQYRWYGAVVSSFGILQNLRVQARLGLPEVKRWQDLADPRLKGWVGAGDPRNSGTMAVMFEGILQYHGWEEGWRVLARMSSNLRRFDRISTTTAKDVTVGETAYGLAIDFYGFTQVAYAGPTNLSYVLPADFATLAPDGIAILRGAPHLKISQRLLEFVMGEPGQKLWFLPRGHPEGAVHNSIDRLSVRPDFYERFGELSNIRQSPFQVTSSFRYNGRIARDRRDTLPALLGAVLVDTHPELLRAAEAIQSRGGSPADWAELGRPPLGESELFSLGTNGWKSVSFRIGQKTEWQKWARDKYRKLEAVGR